jgi:hypothetical protein
LIEHRNGRFAVRERSEIERLLSRAYRAELPLERLMAGLATVASALNANDPGLARIAAVHFADTGPAELDRAGRDGGGRYPHQVGRLESRPASAHRRAAKSGWFAPSGTGQPSPARVAENDTPGQRPDASPTVRDESTIRQSSEDIQENPSLIVPIADNQRQNKQAHDVAVKLNMTKAQADELHRRISSQGYDYHGVLKIRREIVGDE